MQIESICKVGAEENMAVCGKWCDDSSYIIKNFIIWSLHKYFWDDEIKKGDMGRACSMHGRYDNCI